MASQETWSDLLLRLDQEIVEEHNTLVLGHMQREFLNFMPGTHQEVKAVRMREKLEQLGWRFLYHTVHESGMVTYYFLSPEVHLPVGGI